MIILSCVTVGELYFNKVIKKFFTWHRRSKVDEVVDEVLLSSAEAVGACSGSVAAAAASAAVADVAAAAAASAASDAAFMSVPSAAATSSAV